MYNKTRTISEKEYYDMLETLDNNDEKLMDYGQRLFYATEDLNSIIDYIECNNIKCTDKEKKILLGKLNNLLYILATEQKFKF